MQNLNPMCLHAESTSSALRLIQPSSVCSVRALRGPHQDADDRETGQATVVELALVATDSQSAST